MLHPYWGVCAHWRDRGCGPCWQSHLWVGHIYSISFPVTENALLGSGRGIVFATWGVPVLPNDPLHAVRNPNPTPKAPHFSAATVAIVTITKLVYWNYLQVYFSKTSASYFCLNQTMDSSWLVLWELPTLDLHLFLLATLAPCLPKTT